jgi:hypothetical protein
VMYVVKYQLVLGFNIFFVILQMYYRKVAP